VRHANDFNSFAFEVLACPDAIRSSPSPTVDAISWSNEKYLSTKWPVSSAAFARPRFAATPRNA
jgi:hypothetical protein